MALVDFMSVLHKKTKRDYLGRVNAIPKAEAARKAGQWDYDYWDGSRDTGYGGYAYDGRWIPVADDIVRHFALGPGARILDVGCAKGFLVKDLRTRQPGLLAYGLDLSDYAIRHAEPEAAAYLVRGTCEALPFRDGSFAAVIAKDVIHNQSRAGCVGGRPRTAALRRSAGGPRTRVRRRCRSRRSGSGSSPSWTRRTPRTAT